MGFKEDKINAPHRPLVMGELPVAQAIMLSIILFLFGGLTTFLLNPKALILYLSVFILNIVYEYSKEIPLLSNIIFGILIAPCIYYGAMCTNNKGLEVLLGRSLSFLAVAVVLINSVVAFFTHYKDFIGDKVTGKKTIIVYLTPEKAKCLNFLISLLPFSVLFFLDWKLMNPYFVAFMWINLFMLEYTAFLYFKNPRGKNTYYSLKWNFRGAVLFETAFIALVNPLSASVLYLINFIMVGFLFGLHKDHLA